MAEYRVVFGSPGAWFGDGGGEGEQAQASGHRRSGLRHQFYGVPLWRFPGALPTSEMLDQIIEFVSALTQGNVEVAGELKAAHHLVAGLMEELLQQTNSALEVLYKNSEAIAVKVRDVIMVAADFFHKFENVHPFSDGNGRTGRLLLTYLLYPVTRYFPFNFLKDYGGRPK